MLVFRRADAGRDALPAFFRETFAASAGPEEGDVVARLVTDLLATTPADALIIWTARDEAGLAGCICLSRLSWPGDDRRGLLLSPVAVAPDRRGRGIGTALLRHGIEGMRASGFDLVVTYGDPAWYGRAGFAPADTGHLPPPFPLSQPEGWLVLPLTEQGAGAFREPPATVPAMDRPDIW